MKKRRKKDLVKLILIVLLGGILVYGVFRLGYEIYMNSREYTIEDINGIWVYAHNDDGGHRVLYIHDGRMDMVSYEEADESNTGFDWYLAMTMYTIPEGTFNTFSWIGIEDEERTEGGRGSLYSDGHSELHFEFRRNKIYQRMIVGEAEFVRTTEADYPHILKISKMLDQRYELSETALPLEIGEVRCFNRWGATKDEYDSFLYIQVTNPNPFFVDAARVKLRWEGHSKTLTTGLSAIPANSTETYVINISCRDILGLGNTVDPTECTIDFNRYDVFEGEAKPIVEITDSRILRDEKSGHVTQIEVDTREASVTEDKVPLYDLFALFYKQDEIVGVATGMGRLEYIDEPDVMRYVSWIDDYDRYEIVVVNQYVRPLFDR